ncbi:hypothetical protein PSV08DRAFT_334085, partial [Bipolaris maydis]
MLQPSHCQTAVSNSMLNAPIADAPPARSILPVALPASLAALQKTLHATPGVANGLHLGPVWPSEI